MATESEYTTRHYKVEFSPSVTDEQLAELEGGSLSRGSIAEACFNPDSTGKTGIQNICRLRNGFGLRFSVIAIQTIWLETVIQRIKQNLNEWCEINSLTFTMNELETRS